jgi:hypothetical protein
MWRMRRADGTTTHAVITLRHAGATVVWYVNDGPVGVRAFEDWTGAIEWTARMQFQNWTVGWRLTGDDDRTITPQ